MAKSKIFLICCLNFIFGIIIASFTQVKYIQNDLILFALVIGFIAVLVLFWHQFTFRLIALLGLFLFLAIWRYSISLPQNTSDKIWHYNNQTLEIIGIITNEPDIRTHNPVLHTSQGRQKLELSAQKIILQKTKISVSGKVLVTAKLYPKYNYGDRLKIICELQAPTMFNGFAYDRYLARYNIFSVCYYPQVEYLSSNHGNIIYNFIFYF